RSRPLDQRARNREGEGRADGLPLPQCPPSPRDALGAGGRRNAVRAHPRRVDARVRALRIRERDQADAHRAAETARVLPPGRIPDAARNGANPERGPGGRPGSAGGRRMIWNAWGVPERRVSISDAALATLRDELGQAEPLEPIALEDVKLPR